MSYCSACGTAVNGAFCSSCGTKVQGTLTPRQQANEAQRADSKAPVTILAAAVALYMLWVIFDAVRLSDVVPYVLAAFVLVMFGTLTYLISRGNNLARVTLIALSSLVLSSSSVTIVQGGAGGGAYIDAGLAVAIIIATANPLLGAYIKRSAVKETEVARAAKKRIGLFILISLAWCLVLSLVFVVTLFIKAQGAGKAVGSAGFDTMLFTALTFMAWCLVVLIPSHFAWQRSERAAMIAQWAGLIISAVPLLFALPPLMGGIAAAVIGGAYYKLVIDTTIGSEVVNHYLWGLENGPSASAVPDAG